MTRSLAPSDRAGVTLGRALRRDESASGQSAALKAYARRIARDVERLDSLAPPPVLRPWHDGQLARLRAAHGLAADLAAAIDDGDRTAVDRALKAFGTASPDPRVVDRAQAAAVRAFNARIRGQEELVAELARLEWDLGDIVS